MCENVIDAINIIDKLCLHAKYAYTTGKNVHTRCNAYTHTAIVFTVHRYKMYTQ